ncbi:MAG: RHS repeat-associated core domain-containing protein, partial [Flavobacteriaceae bacterium]|nr:RHS repeat-associated core domain-containing protein [Flavobacteriaceae bacterium]
STKTLGTGSRIKVLGTSQWITTITAYDEHKRIIWGATKNQYLETTDIVDSKIKDSDDDIRGLVHETTAIHQKENDSVKVENFFTYDHTGRLLTQTQSIDDDELELIVNNSYDTLGQLESKKVGGDVATVVEISDGLQTIDYTYNVRGWLKNINQDNNIDNDLFNFTLMYNDIVDTSKKLYNGNISQTSWNTLNIDSSVKTYTFGYDALNRITSGIDNTGNYNLTNVAYDKNGNITSLNRKGHINTGATLFGNMDLLVYGYETNSNKLKKVTDTSGKSQGFNDGANQTTEYTYDTNGNLLTDANKGITSILYNHLNLPTEIKFDNSNTKKINYTYDATGVKLQKEVNDGGNLTTTDYANGYIYENNTLQFFNHAEGYVNNDNGTFKYVYNYLDHLGSIRLSYSDGDGNGSISQSEIIKENHYYPYGLKMRGFNSSVSSLGNSLGQKYMFNGKEFDDSFNETLNTYDFGARNYDPALGRWMNLDPLADLAHSISITPYHFVANNPILNVDPDGKDWFENKDGDLMWRKTKGDNGDKLTTTDDVEWTNIGDELLMFNGEQLHFFTQSENEDGELVLGLDSFDSVSGREEEGSFNYSEERQATNDEGPIPEGDYSIAPSKIQYYSDLSIIQKAYSFIDSGEWPGGKFAWGKNRVWINPSAVDVVNPVTGETVTRTNMSIHGGSSPGSAGCIDCHKNADKFFNKLRQSRSKSIRLRVIYPNSKKK